MPKLPYVIRHFDLDLMVINEKGQTMKSTLLRRIHMICLAPSQLLLASDALLIVAKAVDRCAHWLDGVRLP